MTWRKVDSNNEQSGLELERELKDARLVLAAK
jgi:hypothetical protein